jgi:alpha-galactosidase
MTCQRRPGSLGYEVKDANTYADWGVDYLKLDSCYTNGIPTLVEYSIMRDALNASGRSIFYSLCGIDTN